MSLFTKFTSGLMTILAGIEDNNGTTPTNLPQPNLEPNAYTNPDGSVLDLEDSGPIGVPANNHNQQYTPKNGERYIDNLPS
tara:strand:- start:256 stop:498 length:243 start_codon:yes stop_codon:yes gene_type:complete